jgi:DNA primase
VAEYDSEALLELCSKVDLFEYASKSVDFEGRGDSFATHCPKHIDKTPSLVITPSKNLFHCFSCGCGGNIINWLMTFEEMSFEDSLKKVGELAGVDVANLKQCSALSVYKKISRLTPTKLPENQNDNRLVLSETEFNKYIDEVPKEWVDEGINPEVMKRYCVRIDEKANRIVYPIYDNCFNLIGFKGRTRYKNYKDMKIKKYQNYQKIGTTDFFVGMKENIETIKRKSEAIIFEGIKSGMKVEDWGYDNWLSSETGWLNDEQVLILIKMGIKNICIAYDNDVALSKIFECTIKLRKFTNVFAIIDAKKILGRPEDKMSPCDRGREVWETLYGEKRRI